MSDFIQQQSYEMIVCGALSLVASAAIVLTYVVFPDLRGKCIGNMEGKNCIVNLGLFEQICDSLNLYFIAL